jgi:transposase
MSFIRCGSGSGAAVRIQAVAMNMSEAYIQALRKNLMAATIVFNHIHVINLFNDILQQFRL